MLTVRNVARSFDKTPVLRGVDLEVEQGEIVCLLGASGSGKTTLLRVIAGLEMADSGDVLLNRQSIIPVPVYQRDFGLMFQDFALFPHMNVFQNVAFGLRMRGMRRKEQQQRVQEVLELVGLSGFEKRDVAGLSGGERQRVALARSLAPNPRLLLLDEPFGALDASLRERLALEVREIIQNAGLTAIHVTHDQQEAFAIGDRIAIMHRGQIEQIDTPEAIYHQPKTTYVARFLGLSNILRDGAQIVLLHPDGIMPDERGEISGIVRERVFLGDAYRVTMVRENMETLTFKAKEAPPTGETIRVTAERRIRLTESEV
jgi:ABC-type Fe3+/spermidine/putrescine transport system ATPase subunit